MNDPRHRPSGGVRDIDTGIHRNERPRFSAGVRNTDTDIHQNERPTLPEVFGIPVRIFNIKHTGITGGNPGAAAPFALFSPGKTDRLAQRILSPLPVVSRRRGEKRREQAVPSLPLSPKAPASRGCGRQGRPPVYPAAAVPVRDAARGSVRTHFRSPFFWTRWERTPALSSALPICSTE